MAEPFIGEIRMVGFLYAPKDWANADGQMMSIQQNPALYSLYGTTYGGDGVQTFGLPDFRGRVPIHVGHGAGLPDFYQGEAGGWPTVVLQADECPVHTHPATANAKAAAADQPSPDGNFWAQPGRNGFAIDSDCTMNPSAVEVGANSGGQPHMNMQPFLTIRFCVSLEGIYPQRP